MDPPRKEPQNTVQNAHLQRIKGAVQDPLIIAPVSQAEQINDHPIEKQADYEASRFQVDAGRHGRNNQEKQDQALYPIQLLLFSFRTHQFISSQSQCFNVFNR